MSFQGLLSTYSWTGDLICLILCICLLFLIKRSIVYSDDLKFKLLVASIVFVTVGACANMLFYVFVALETPYHITLYVTRTINHLCLLSSLFLFVYYISILLDLEKTTRKRMGDINFSLVLLGIFFDSISPITHFGFYLDDNHLWHDATYLKPYTIVYILFLAELCILFIYYQKRIIKQIIFNYIMVIIVCIAILIAENVFDSNTFTTFTFVLPITLTFILIHSNPYNLNSGALGREALNRYLDIARKEKKNISYLILHLYMDEFEELPHEIGRTMHSLGRMKLKYVTLFSLSNEYYLLAIDESKEKIEVLPEIKSMLDNEFVQCYQKFHIDYKLMVMQNLDFILRPNDVMPTIYYLESLIKKNEIIFVDQELLDQLKKKNMIAQELDDIYLKKDLNDERIWVYCQPIKNTSEDTFNTAEALMRINSPTLGMIFPDQFIPVAESYGYIHILSLIILNKVCAQIKALERKNLYIKRVSVNFSISEFENADFSSEVLKIIEDNEISYDKIGIEITESKNTRNSGTIERQIEILREKGIIFYLDDFGTGYSNFDRIMSMGFDIIKFDRSLLLHMDTHPENRAIVNSFANAFHQLKYAIVFEGVENDDYEALCHECGSDYLQGYKYSKPIPIEQLEQFLEPN